MQKLTIESKISKGKKLSVYPDSILKNEPMLFNCTFSYAMEYGGAPTKEFLLALPEGLHNDNTIIDSRVHMLMKGWYPCIPGFHHDDVPREREDNQPEYFNPSYRSQHAMVLYNGNVCPTEFAIGKAEFIVPPLNEIIYKQWHKDVVEKLDKGELGFYQAPADQVIFFDDRTWHQGTQAQENGWRLFIRASWKTGRQPTNEMRRQVQVYLEHPMEGW